MRHYLYLSRSCVTLFSIYECLKCNVEWLVAQEKWFKKQSDTISILFSILALCANSSYLICKIILYVVCSTINILYLRLFVCTFIVLEACMNILIWLKGCYPISKICHNFLIWWDFNLEFSTRGSFWGRTQKKRKLPPQRLIEPFASYKMRNLDANVQQ